MLTLVVLITLALPASSSTTHDIEIRNFAYSPTPITITAGDFVRWTNFDNSEHTATKFFDPSGWSTPQLLNGESAEVQFNDAGTFPYYCLIHGSSMVGSIEVLAAPDTVVPEAPMVVLLSAGGVAMLAVWFSLNRRRRPLTPTG